MSRLGKKGGFSLELSGPASQDAYLAVVRPGQGVRSFPFYEGVQAGGAEAYTGQVEEHTPGAGDSPATSGAGEGDVR